MQKPFDTQRIVWHGLRFFLVIAMSAVLEGCGGSSHPVNPPVPGASTNVVVLLTSTANDKLVQFGVQINSVSLRDSAGNMVTLFNDPSRTGISGITEFMRLNGASQPLVTSSVPQGTYTSATVKVSSCGFGTVTIAAGGMVDSFFGQGLCSQGTGNTMVNLPSPIVISGPAMALTFDLQVSQSYTLAAGNIYTISPVFKVTPVFISPNPTNDGNGKVTGLNAKVISVDTSANSFVAQTADRTSLTLSSNSGTVYQGLAGLANLSPGTVVNLDSAIQLNGSLLATRVEAQSATALTTDIGLGFAPASPAGSFGAVTLECFHRPGSDQACYSAFQAVSSTVFHVSGQSGNLEKLPFAPNFSGTSFVLGQNVLIDTNDLDGMGGMITTDITLEEQTVNGTVTAVTSTGGFSIYTVTLAPYHIIPTVQQLPFLAPFAVIASPATITIYADANTQLLQSGSVTPGSVLRFRGLVFSDNGTLRMDCAKILDGVAQ